MSTITETAPVPATRDERGRPVKKRREGANLWLSLLAWVVGILFVLPVVWMVLTSFHSEANAAQNPPAVFVPLTLEGYREFFSGGASPWPPLLNSLTASVVSTALVLLLAFPAAYALSIKPVKKWTDVLFFFLSTKMLPVVAGLLPIYLFAQQVGLLDNIWLLIVFYTSMNLPIAVWMMRSFLSEVPVEMLEAASVDGAGLTRTLRSVESVPDPAPGALEVVVRPAAVGICGTDLHIMDGEFAPSFPIVPGHEFAGEIVAVGAQVTGYAVGDQVAVDPSLYCGHCYYCKRARGNQCENWNAIGVTVPGAAAEYVAAPMANLFRLPSHLPARDAALIEPLSCAVRGFDVLSRTMADTYLIYGSGTMGLMMLELAKRAGAGSVSVVDLNPERLETAKRLGCSAAVTSADELDAPRGWDVVIDCTGAEAAIRDGLGRVGPGGTFLQFGVANYDARVAVE